jgi:hypothetical protein
MKVGSSMMRLVHPSIKDMDNMTFVASRMLEEVTHYIYILKRLKLKGIYKNWYEIMK